MNSESFLMFICIISPVILVFVGLGLGFFQDNYLIASDEQGFKWVPATAIGLIAGCIITFSLLLSVNFPAVLVAGVPLWVYPFTLIGWICSLFQVRTFVKKQAYSYLAVSWIGSFAGAIFGGVINYWIQLLNENAEPTISYFIQGCWVHILIIISIYGIVTSGMLYILSRQIRKKDRRISLAA